MAQADKERWDEKYQNNPIPNEPIKLVSDYASLATGPQALDIACGMGRHSKYLASKGFTVDALDISSVAIEHLNNIPNINAIEVDFDTFTLPKEKYDLIVCTYFLERRLFPQMIDALKPNGIILLETFLHDAQNERIPSNPDFLLSEGELEATFYDKCELLHNPEFWDEDYQGYKTMKTSMVAKKKSAGIPD
ncbi:MAG: class I SAM-dependent methyltransferase [Sulfurovum sp.]|uniref:class I SAM-dependent methyltransferase n=1 Tax=Sulfurovum sp. TaxID=1969726 RepID=UPI00286829DA|nr:class I SAM-dependent methyltransferase [Sulfurovum sp.]MCO4845924.1 class I SAM-dependent methyltransferase [Sulfurovum sp.]